MTKLYECIICNFSTSLLNNYNRHLNTKKHSKISGNVVMESAKEEKKKEGDLSFEKMENEKLKIQLENLKLKLEIDKLKNTNSSPKINYSTNTEYCDNSINDKQNANSQKLAFLASELAMPVNGLYCIYCNKIFKHQSSLCRHHKDCFSKKIALKNNSIDTSEGNVCIKNVQKYPKVSIKKETYIKNIDELYTCKYCQNNYSNSRSLSKHIRICSSKFYKEKEENDKKEKEKMILEKNLEKEKALNQEKDKTIEIAKNAKGTVTNINNNKTINYLNQNFGDMIAMEKFIYNLEHHEKLNHIERKNLLFAYNENGIDVFSRNFSYIMKQNCKRQLEKEGKKDMKILPLFCSDGSLRSHKEKGENGWKTHYDNNSINQMLNISNDQIYESHQEIIPITGKERNKVYNEVKRDNNLGKGKLLKKLLTIKNEK